MSETYISCDVEADGPIPGRYSMLSLGAAAFTQEGQVIGTWTANFVQLPWGIQDPSTMKFWSENPDAWKACRENVKDPTSEMKVFKNWLSKFDNPVLLEYPGSFDFQFIHWYLVNFAGSDQNAVDGNPMGFSSLAIRSYAAGALAQDYKDIYKKHLKQFRSNRRHTHIALDDALEQGEMFLNLVKHNKDKKSRQMAAFRDILDLATKGGADALAKIKALAKAEIY